jgi:hypothetical protein
MHVFMKLHMHGSMIYIATQGRYWRGAAYKPPPPPPPPPRISWDPIFRRVGQKRITMHS